MTIQFKHSTGLVAILLLLGACKKDKFDVGYDNRPVTENRKKSNVRIINLSDYNQVIANGDSLTNFIVKNPNEMNGDRFPGTAWFPTNGRLGKVWEVPMDVFDAQEKVELTIAARHYNNSSNGTIRVLATNNYTAPTDYVLLPVEHMNGQPAVVPIPRGVSAPSRPDHFKIRIVHLSGEIKNPAFTAGGPQEKLEGPVTLAYADGTPVSEKTSHVGNGSPVSEYVEVPYGTYQFRVLSEDGRQLRASLATSKDHSLTLIEPANSSLPINYSQSSHLVYAPIEVYQPGGLYTVFVAPQRFNYLINELGEESFTYQNAFQVISDNSPAANVTYCRIQGVNALGDQPVTIKANGKDIATGLGFGTPGEYARLVTGTYQLEAADASGKVIAQAEQVLRPAQNYTAWLHPAADGSTRLLVVANDLSGTWYRGGSEDGTLDRFQYDFYFFRRYLNLSPENPYISFTTGNGQSSSGQGDNQAAGVNLQPGMPVMEQPYVRSGYTFSSYEVMAYRSAPTVVPGTWADDIPVLRSQQFIADQALYTKAGKGLPVHEPGIYTVALIGRTGNAVPKARMMILKHNK